MDNFFILLQIIFSLALLKVGISHFRKIRKERLDRVDTAPPRPVAQPLGSDVFADPGRNWQQKVPPTPPKKPWWSVYRYSLGTLIFFALFIAGRLWFIHGNPPPQSLDELEMQTVDVVDWRVNGSRLYVRLPSGDVQQVEFPSLDFKGPGLYLTITLDEQKALIGQRCQMWGRPLRRVLEERFQVFALQCDRGGGLKFQAAIKSYEIGFEVTSGGFGNSLFLVFMLPWLAVLFLMEYFQNKRLNKQRGQK